MNTHKPGTHTVSVTANDLLLILYTLLFLVNRTIPLDPLSLWKYTLLFLIYIIIRTIRTKYTPLIITGIILWGIIESILVLLQKYYIIESHHSLFPITGTFGNPGPLGGYLSITLTLFAGAVILLFKKHTLLRNSFLIGTLLLISNSLLLSGSRAAWLGTLAGISLLIAHQIPSIKRILKTSSRYSYCLKAGVILLLLLFLSGLYHYKKDSADGRLLIWKITTQMIQQKPIPGYGSGGWLANYMHFQAAYFHRHPDSAYTQLADNVAYPYNEYLYIATEQGIPGLLIVLLLLWFTLSHPAADRTDTLIKAGITTFAAFAFFSYPFHVLPLIILLTLLLAVAKSKTLYTLQTPVTPYYAITSLILVCLCAITTWSWQLDQKYTKNIHQLIQAKENTSTIQSFLDHSYPLYTYNPEFMDIYARYSIQHHTLEKAENILAATSRIAPSSELYCDLGDLQKQKGNISLAEEYYQTAANMTPAHLTPKYKLFELYADQKDSIAARKMATIILERPIKVEGTQTLKMKARVQNYLESMNQ